MPTHVGREQGLCQQHVPVPVPRLRTSAVPLNLHPLSHRAEIKQRGQKLPGEQPHVCTELAARGSHRGERCDAVILALPCSWCPSLRELHPKAIGVILQQLVAEGN